MQFPQLKTPWSASKRADEAIRLFAWVLAMVLGIGISASKIAAQVTPTDSVRSGKGAIKGAAPADTTLRIQMTDHIESGDSTVLTGPAVSDSTEKGKREKGSHAFKIHLSPKKDVYDPKVAVRRSLILPGWGQIYNNRIWKVPIVYGGFAVFIALVIQNNQGYREFDRAFKCTGIPNSCVPNPYYQMAQQYTLDGLLSNREQYRRNRDFNVILCGLWYVLNVVDAYVDSHLRNFNVSDDLSMNVDPTLLTDPFRPKSLLVGASLTFNLKK